MDDDNAQRDFLSSPLGAVALWGLPIAAMLAMIGTPHPIKTWVWVGALVWMGTACLWNARRCQRKHCFWTGPFFLAMTLPVLAHGYGVVSFGAEGWKWLAIAIGVGGYGLVMLTERGGRYS